MSLLELFILAVGLSMDAFAVSVCKGLSVDRIRPRHALICGAYFGVFQALMPLIGYLLGVRFQGLIQQVDHWIAFVLLTLIGINMLREAFGKDEAESVDASFGFRTMLMLAVATSIDALAVGISFALLEVNIWQAIAIIGCTTCALSIAGVGLGNRLGELFKKRAALAGGVILIVIGVKILIEHLLG